VKPGALLHELVATPSVSGDEAAAAAFVVDLLQSRGVDVKRIGDSVLARCSRGSGPSLLLTSHLDTVPVGEGWTRDPAGVWEGEKLYGRGANDAKASVAAMIAAFLGDKSEWRGEVWLALNACEETSNAGMADVLEHAHPIDGAVVGEPTGLEVARAQSGLAIVRAEWSGRSCHAAHVARVEHDNALTKAAAELARAAPFLTLDGEHPLLGKSTVAPTVLRAGERHNVVPDHAEALFDARLAPPHTAADVVAALARALPAAELHVKSDRLVAVETADEHPLVRAAVECAGRSAAVGSATLSDMALLAGIPAVKCGPGETARSHTPDEYVLASEVEAGAAFYAALVPAALAALAIEEVKT
jgi:acetylornithine deacetylase